MSWPDGWTAVDGDKTPDNRRYAACGNGVVSNVSEWIGRRIMAVEREG
jgi:site-specific DNA-cytosine methylase